MVVCVQFFWNVPLWVYNLYKRAFWVCWIYNWDVKWINTGDRRKKIILRAINKKRTTNTKKDDDDDGEEKEEEGKKPTHQSPSLESLILRNHTENLYAIEHEC